MIRVPKLRDVRVRQDGTRVLLIVDGKTVLEGHWRQFDELARAFVIKARAAEEIDKAAAIVEDQALLFRAGARFGLTNHPRLRELAGNIAAWSTRLRRYLPGGIKSQEMFGTPTIIRKDA